MTWLSLSLRLAGRCLAHPSITPDLVVIAWRFRERGWFRRFPFLPLPAPEYIRWRMHTAYGDPHTVPPVDDVVRYARWARRVNRTG
ncbi:MAG TPA: hypothetical protein VHE78_03780 [Gemmatimonadaceae bacterium]|nr:hypothetical protein [Gemmatimonadaceae bacterium]